MASKNKEETPLQILDKTLSKTYSRSGVPLYKHFQIRVKEYLEEDDNFAQLHLWEETNPESVKILFDCLLKAKANTLQSIRLWKINMGDEGMQGFVKYFQENPQVSYIDFLDNSITEVGCRQLGSALYQQPNSFQIKKLFLDHNPIGDEGLCSLMNGLRKCQSLEELSLSFCNLGTQSAHYIQQILMFVNSNIKILNLQGNDLGNEGFYQILRALESNTTLVEINISDNSICESADLVDLLTSVLKNTKTLQKVDLTYNGIYQQTAEKILKLEREYKQTKITLTDRFEANFTLEYNAFFAKLKLKKKKGKGKKKKQLITKIIYIMEFIFLYDAKNNSFLHMFPQQQIQKFQQPLQKQFEGFDWSQLEIEERKKFLLGKKRKVLGFKMKKYIFSGVVARNEEKERFLMAMLQILFNKVKQTRKIKNNKDIEQLVVELKKQYEQGDFKDQASLNKEKILKAQQKGNQNIQDAKEMNKDLEILEDKTEQLKEKAKQASENAAAIHYEAFWLNQKWNILIYGTLSLLTVLIILYVVRIIL